MSQRTVSYMLLTDIDICVKLTHGPGKDAPVHYMVVMSINGHRMGHSLILILGGSSERVPC